MQSQVISNHMWKLTRATRNVNIELTRMRYDVSDGIYFIEDCTRASERGQNGSR